MSDSLANRALQRGLTAIDSQIEREIRDRILWAFAELKAASPDIRNSELLKVLSAMGYRYADTNTLSVALTRARRANGGAETIKSNKN